MTFQYTDPSEMWPPPTYRSGGAFNEPKGQPLRISSPLEPQVRIAADGTRHLSYQLPKLPIDKTQPLFISGVIRIAPDGVNLLDWKDRVVGTINTKTGIFDLDIDKAPGPCTRFVEYYSGGTQVLGPPAEEDLRFPFGEGT